MRLPKIPYTMDKDQSVQIPFRGINYSDMLTDGDVADSRGISMRRYPFITTRRGRELNADASNKDTDTIFPYNGELASVRDGVLYKGEDAVTYKDANETVHEHVVGSGAKFAKINSKLVSFGVNAEKKVLKKYYDTNKEFIDPVSGKLVPVSGELEVEVEAQSVMFKKNGLEVGFSKITSGLGGTFDSEKKTFTHIASSEIKLSGKWVVYGYNAFHVRRVAEQTESVFTLIDGCIAAVFEKDNIDIDFIKEHGSYIDTYVTQIESDGEETFLGCRSCYGYKYESETVPGATGVMLLFDLSSGINESLNGINVYLPDAPTYQLTEQIRVGLSIRIGDENASESTIKEVRDRYFVAQEAIFSDARYFPNGLSITATSAWEADLTTLVGVRDTIKFVGSKNNTKSYVIESVTQDTITFNADSAIYNESSIWTKFELWIAGEGSKDIFFKFKKGDAVTISGCKTYPQNDITFVINSLSGAGIYASADIFTESAESDESDDITISRKVPKLDFICESENRLWGCNSAENTVYVSALGDPTNMYAYEGVSTDSFATAVGSEGDFTGCCKYGSSVLFFKEDRIHKFLGSYPAEYTLYSYEVDGVQAGSEKSLVVINEVLYYKGTYGVYAYDGGVPRLISECFGDRSFYNAVAGTDGVNYYISMNDSNGQWYLFVYNTRTGMWVLEDHIQSRDFARVGRTLYYLDDDGKVWSLDNGCTVDKEAKTVDEEVKTVDKPIEWMVQFTPFYETIEGRKSYSRILMRAEVPLGSYIELKIRCDDGRWAELGRIVGKMRGVVPIRIPINRCDKFELRLEGKGECTIHSMLREYYVGGVR